MNNMILDATDQIKSNSSIRGKKFHKENIFLRLDPGSHTDIIKDMAISKDKKLLVTGSEDSYVRIWDIKSGKMLRKISGYIGSDGSTGNIYAVALSNDNKYLAVAGNFSRTGTAMKNMFTDDIKFAGAIRIYDFKTGELLHVLYGHNNVVNDLSFSEDSKLLLSASNDNTIRIWEVGKNFIVKKVISRHSSLVRAIDIKKVKNKYQIVSVSPDGAIFLHSYDLIHNKLKLLKSLKYNNRLSDVKFSKNFIAITGLRKIFVYDRSFKLLKTINTEKPYNFRPRFSSDEKYLACAGSEVCVYDIKKNYRKIASYKGHQDTVRSLELLNNNTIISASLTVNMFNYKNNKSISRFQTQYKPIYSVGLYKGKISFGHSKYDYSKIKFDFNNRGPLEKVFNIEKRRVSKVQSVKNYHLLPRRYEWQKLYPVSNNTKLAVYDRGQKIMEIPTGLLSPGTRNRTFGFYNEDDYILTALDRSIYAFSNSMFDLVHMPETVFIGHTGTIYAMAIDDKTLLSGGTDDTLKLWDLNKVDKQEIVYPKVSLFVADNNEWVMWTKEGFFDSSANGYKYIGFHINHGPEKNADFIGIEKLYDHFFRPDLVKLALKGKDISSYTNHLNYKEVLQSPPPIITIKSKEKLVTNKDKIKINFLVEEEDKGGIGIIRIYQEGKLVQTLGNGKINRKAQDVIKEEEENRLNEISKKRQEKYLSQLKVSAKSVDGTLKDSELVAPIELEHTQNYNGVYSIEVPLKAGVNNISIEAFNKTNTVLSIRKNVKVIAKIKKRKPKIYVIAAGVNEFEQNNVSKLKYSENDAKTIAKEIKNATEYKTEVTLLTGKKVTKDNILKAIHDVKKKAHLEDKIVFYISTHGKAARGRLYLVPQNNKKLKNWINFGEIFKEIQAVRALDQIFIIDACESGEASDIMSSVYDAKASVLAKQSGVHLLMATTKGTFAFESANKNVKHGVFTNNILKALNSKTTDKNKNGKISIVELSTTLEEPKYSVDHQFPIIRNVGEDIYIKKVKK